MTLDSKPSMIKKALNLTSVWNVINSLHTKKLSPYFGAYLGPYDLLLLLLQTFVTLWLSLIIAFKMSYYWFVEATYVSELLHFHFICKLKVPHGVAYFQSLSTC